MPTFERKSEMMHYLFRQLRAARNTKLMNGKRSFEYQIAKGEIRGFLRAIEVASELDTECATIAQELKLHYGEVI